MPLNNQRIQCSDSRPFITWSTKTSLMRFFTWDTEEECVPTCWVQWEAKDPVFNKVQWELKVWIKLWHSLPETWTEQEELMHMEEVHNSPDASKDGWKHSTPSILKIMDFPKCSYADTNASPVNSKVEMPFKLCDEKDSILEPISPLW